MSLDLHNKSQTKIEILISNTEAHVLLIIDRSIPFNANYRSACGKSVRLGMKGEMNVSDIEERKSATIHGILLTGYLSPIKKSKNNPWNQGRSQDFQEGVSILEK